MASWMIHLRLADRLLDAIEHVEPTAFVVGNIAPDSGVPSDDGFSYAPPKEKSHFQIQTADGKKKIDVDAFVRQYCAQDTWQGYDRQARSFFLGYWTHLLTDVAWVEKIYKPALRRYPEEWKEDRAKLTWKFKRDWYDLDFLFLEHHPDFRAYRLYESAVGFENRYMDFFSPDAFENRRQYICGFYRGGHGNLDREYPYLTKEEADRFVEDTAAQIEETLFGILV